MYPFSFFLKMDLSQDASRNGDKMSIFTEESKKMQFGGKCNNVDVMGEGLKASFVNYCRYNFLIKSGRKKKPDSLFFLLLLY